MESLLAYTCIVHFIFLFFQIGQHFSELEQVGHNPIMTILGSIQERGLLWDIKMALSLRLKSIIQEMLMTLNHSW